MPLPPVRTPRKVPYWSPDPDEPPKYLGYPTPEADLRKDLQALERSTVDEILPDLIKAIPGLVIWLRADDLTGTPIVTAETPILWWPDYPDRDHDFRWLSSTPPGGSGVPTKPFLTTANGGYLDSSVVPNQLGFPGVGYPSGANGQQQGVLYVNSDAALETESYTIIVVGSFGSSIRGSPNEHFSKALSPIGLQSSYQFKFQNTGTLNFPTTWQFLAGDGQAVTVPNANIPPGSRTLMTARRDFSANTLRVYAGGLPFGTQTAAIPVASSGPLWLGTWDQGSGAGQTIYEFFYFNVALPTADRQAVEEYLASKWGCAYVGGAA